MKSFTFCFGPIKTIDLKWIGGVAVLSQEIWLSRTEEQAR